MINNYDSIDKLIDFGMGLAVAQQMIKTMNSVMDNVQAPQVKNPTISQQFGQPQQAQIQLYVGAPEGVAGPFNEQEVSALIREGKLTAESLVWMPGMMGWGQATTVPIVNKYLMLNA